MKVLVLGIGNPGRRDDGLGPRLAGAAAGEEGVRAESRYQLNVEDALAVRDQDAVIFVDAARTGDAPAAVREIAPAASVSFTTHALPPEAVLALCLELYGRKPRAWLLAVRGYDWEVGEGLSAGAERSLAAALDLLHALLSELRGQYT